MDDILKRGMKITKQHDDLVESVKKAMGEWRKFTVAVDGVDGSGKSTLARFLAWQIGMPAIETDMFLNSRQEKEGDLKYRVEDIKRLIEARHSLNRPVIIEGVFLLILLKEVGLQPDFLIYIEEKGNGGSTTWSEWFADYYRKYCPKEKANSIFSWSKGSLT